MKASNYPDMDKVLAECQKLITEKEGWNFQFDNGSTLQEQKQSQHCAYKVYRASTLTTHSPKVIFQKKIGY
jgi:hypothetical protein